jgi:outer membrane protein assembly factor BamD
MRRLVLLILFGSALTACGGGGSGALSYGQNARRAYADALDEFYDDDCFEAEPLLKEVRRQFPYSRFAALSELRVADCHFREERQAEAIEAYNQFVRYHPSHPEVPYARYMAARAHFDQIPSEWLLSPASYERDQYYPQESLRLLRRFILDFPEDSLVTPARRMAQQAIEVLSAHELYAARFYFDREHPEAAVGRLRTLLSSYPGCSLEPEALVLLGESYIQLRDFKLARRAFGEVVARFPSDDHASRAREALGNLGG